MKLDALIHNLYSTSLPESAPLAGYPTFLVRPYLGMFVGRSTAIMVIYRSWGLSLLGYSAAQHASSERPVLFSQYLIGPIDSRFALVFAVRIFEYQHLRVQLRSIQISSIASIFAGSRLGKSKDMTQWSENRCCCSTSDGLPTYAAQTRAIAPDQLNLLSTLLRGPPSKHVYRLSSLRIS